MNVVTVNMFDIVIVWVNMLNVAMIGVEKLHCITYFWFRVKMISVKVRLVSQCELKFRS